MCRCVWMVVVRNLIAKDTVAQLAAVPSLRLLLRGLDPQSSDGQVRPA